jgi:sialate O-acetylesterase
MSMDTLGSNAGFMPVFASWAHFSDPVSENDLRIAAEKRQDEAAAKANQPAPKHDWHPDPSSWKPAGLYNGMIAPLVPYTLKGAIWYQGETNSEPARAPMYATLFPALIGDWRAKWQEGNFPFFYVQISNYSSPDEDWGIVRDAQRRTLSVVNTGMAVTLDVGDPTNVHSADKQTVGSRLALAARATTYGESIEYSGPLFRTATVEGPSMRIWFDHAKNGLASHGATVEGFEIAGEDGKFVPATAKIDGSTVVVQGGSIKIPKAVRYGWGTFTPANLFNKESLPASTFTSE